MAAFLTTARAHAVLPMLLLLLLLTVLPSFNVLGLLLLLLAKMRLPFYRLLLDSRSCNGIAMYHHNCNQFKGLHIAALTLAISGYECAPR